MIPQVVVDATTNVSSQILFDDIFNKIKKKAIITNNPIALL
jgi:hypothetical protein